MAMNNKDVVLDLQKKIYATLEPLIGESVVLTDCPYHGNVGDILIWEGERMFLDKLNVNVKSQTSLYTFPFKKIASNVTICLHGGGNFGDLYRTAQNFRRKIISHYRNNRIIIFPQSVWYENWDLIELDVYTFSLHPDLYICARDIVSYNFLKKYFSSNHILLVPDMAFCIENINDFAAKNKIQDKKNLYFRRLDKEAVAINSDYIPQDCDIRDWPLFENKMEFMSRFSALCFYLNKINGKIIKKTIGPIFDKIMIKYFKPKLIKQGVEILSTYDNIYTTRLHALILGILLDKHVIGLDNSTKKLSAFYETWLTDDSDVSLQN